MDNLFRNALIISLLGIFLLMFLSNNLELKLTSIKDINKGEIENFVRVEGEATQIESISGILIFNLEENESEIKVVCYEEVNGFENQKVEVIGKVVEYKGEIEIDAFKIKRI